MSRKRKQKTTQKHTPTLIQKVIHTPKKIIHSRRNKTVIYMLLLSAFILCLFLNSYFNYTYGECTNPEGTTVASKYYYLGPDPYYNIRTITETLRNNGTYVYTTEVDPLLNYPLGTNGARPPLFNMIAIFSATIIEQFGVPEIDAIGLATQFLPAIYGALLIFPTYLIGKELFGEKVGIISAILIPLIPVHLGSGHGSAFALFDHDSFILLITTIMFFFIIKTLKEQDRLKSLIYATFAGLMLGSISLTWVASHLLYIMIAAFIFVNLYFELIKTTKSYFNTFKFIPLFLTAFIVSLPYYSAINLVVYYPLLLLIFSIVMFILHYTLIKANLPWLLSIPINITIFGSIFFYLQLSYNKVIPSIVENNMITQLSQIIFGGGLYSSKVEMTIAEGSTYGMSALAMMFGPTLFWLGLIGFIFLLCKSYLERFKPEHVFYSIMFIISFSLLTQAGRFVNDLVPFFAILSAFSISIILSKLNFPNTLRTTITSNLKWYHLTATLGLFLTLIGPFVFIDKLTPIQSALYMLVQIPCLLSFIPIFDNLRNETYLKQSNIEVTK